MKISLQNGKLKFLEGGLNEEQIKSLYKKFRTDLLDGNIIHYRPIAFQIEDAFANSIVSNIDKIPNFGYSVSELSFILDNIIVSEKRGIIPSKLQGSAALTKLTSDCSFITLSGTTIGTEVPESIFYCGEGISSTPKMLLKDMTIFRKLKQPVSITVVLMRGKGRRDFADNLRLIHKTTYKPMRTTYTLHQYFSLREYRGGDYIELNYFEDIDEAVLSQILSEYFAQEETIKCLD